MYSPRKSLSEKLYQIGSESFEDYQEARAHRANEKKVMLFYLMISALIWGAMWLAYNYALNYDWMECILFFSVIGLPIASWWNSKITAYYMNVDQMEFWPAFRLTVYQKIMILSFLPIVGSLFESTLNVNKREDD